VAQRPEAAGSGEDRQLKVSHEGKAARRRQLEAAPAEVRNGGVLAMGKSQQRSDNPQV
jgi:hypothetical protein